jgi:hypothetical protein
MKMALSWENWRSGLTRRDPSLQVIMSTENLYNRVKANSKIGHAEEHNPLIQLEAIGNFVGDCAFMLKQWKRQQATS